jgi:hypothetical protein
VHTMRQSNAILHMNKGNIAEPRKYLDVNSKLGVLMTHHI